MDFNEMKKNPKVKALLEKKVCIVTNEGPSILKIEELDDNQLAQDSRVHMSLFDQFREFLLKEKLSSSETLLLLDFIDYLFYEVYAQDPKGRYDYCSLWEVFVESFEGIELNKTLAYSLARYEPVFQ